jgi:hypothetical protein
MQRRGPQYLGSDGFTRQKPSYSGIQEIRKELPPLPQLKSRADQPGYKTLSPEAAKKIAEALKVMLSPKN